jgi:hypothetical protein
VAEADVETLSPFFDILLAIFPLLVGLMASNASNVDGQTYPAVGLIATDGVVLVKRGWSRSECNVSPKIYSERIGKITYM